MAFRDPVKVLTQLPADFDFHRRQTTDDGRLRKAPAVAFFVLTAVIAATAALAL